MGTPSNHRSEGKIFVAKNGSFLEKEFLSKEVSGIKVELDEVIVPSPELENSSSLKSIPVMPTPIWETVLLPHQVLPLERESGAAQENVPVMPTPTEVS